MSDASTQLRLARAQFGQGRSELMAVWSDDRARVVDSGALTAVDTRLAGLEQLVARHSDEQEAIRRESQNATAARERTDAACDRAAKFARDVTDHADMAMDHCSAAEDLMAACAQQVEAAMRKLAAAGPCLGVTAQEIAGQLAKRDAYGKFATAVGIEAAKAVGSELTEDLLVGAVGRTLGVADPSAQGGSINLEEAVQPLMAYIPAKFQVWSAKVADWRRRHLG